MSKVAKIIDPALISRMKEKILDPEYIQVAVSGIANIISIQMTTDVR